MIDALISGRLYGTPTAREARNGNRFATAKLRASAGGGEVYFVNVIAFDNPAVTVLLGLSDGDSVALSGELTPKVYKPRDGGEPVAGLELLAHKVLSAYGGA